MVERARKAKGEEENRRKRGGQERWWYVNYRRYVNRHG